MLKNFMALLSGILFGVGLTVSQMVNPEKIIHFLSVFTPNWDVSLLLVMLGALLIFRAGYYFWCQKHDSPILTDKFHLPVKTRVDRNLILGAALFGLGWGISGLCPGPALSNLLSGNIKIFAFIVMMGFGSWVAQKIGQ